MKRILILSLALCATRLIAKEATIAPTGTMYMIEAKVLSLSAGALGTNAMAIVADSLTMSTNGDWGTGGKISAAEDLLSKLEKAEGVDVLSAPRITTRAGQEATIQIVREIAYMVPETNVLYRVRQHWFSEDSVEAISNGLYRMQTLASDLNPGITLTITSFPAGENTVKTDVKFRYNLLTKMTPLADSKIKLGEPVIESRKIDSTIATRFGDWVVLGGAQKVRREEDKREENIIVFLRVTKVDAAGSGAAPAVKPSSQ